MPYDGAVNKRGEKVIGGVPGYYWRYGCGPTGAGMIIGYWDGHGFPLLIPGDASTQTSLVNQAIGSDGHFTDYSMPIDDEGTGLLRDNSYYGGAHASNCTADFMKTSWYTRGNLYGWSWFSDADNSLVGYVGYANDAYGADYWADSWNENWGTFTWSKFVAEIDADHPVGLLVDTDGNGSTDHFVTAIGYRDVGGPQKYACLDTWAPPEQIRWEVFQPLGVGNQWGVHGATYFRIDYDCNGNGTPDGQDISGGYSDDCNNDQVPDECELFGNDCNTNDVPDECDVDPSDPDGDGLVSEDCNENITPDECELAPRSVIFVSDQLPISRDPNAPASFNYSPAPFADGEVMLTFTASAHLGAVTTYVNVDLSGTYLGYVFAVDAGYCSDPPDVEQIPVSAATYNEAIAGGAAVINMLATSSVDPNGCAVGSFISVTVEYVAHGADCNTNDTPDDCDIADCPPDTAACDDCNENGVPDECDISDMSSRDTNVNGVPDECEDQCGDVYEGFIVFDADDDYDVDLSDFLWFQVCFTGPTGSLPPGDPCLCHDFDGDGDVDLSDFLGFQTSYTGPGGP